MINNWPGHESSRLSLRYVPRDATIYRSSSGLFFIRDDISADSRSFLWLALTGVVVMVVSTAGGAVAVVTHDLGLLLAISGLFLVGCAFGIVGHREFRRSQAMRRELVLDPDSSSYSMSWSKEHRHPWSSTGHFSDLALTIHAVKLSNPKLPLSYSGFVALVSTPDRFIAIYFDKSRDSLETRLRIEPWSAALAKHCEVGVGEDLQGEAPISL